MRGAVFMRTHRALGDTRVLAFGKNDPPGRFARGGNEVIERCHPGTLSLMRARGGG